MQEATYVCKRCKYHLPESSFGRTKRTGRRKSYCLGCLQYFRLKTKQHVAKLKKIAPWNDAIGGSYYGRMIWMRDIGFESYDEYLKSDLWHQIRSRIFAMKGRSCWLCGSTANELHHLRYGRKDLLGKRSRNIFPICRECHHKIEFRNGEKVSVDEARSAFKLEAMKMDYALGLWPT